jgi:hypothetical protein
MDGCAADETRYPRPIESRVVAKSSRVSLGKFPANARWNLMRPDNYFLRREEMQAQRSPAIQAYLSLPPGTGTPSPAADHHDTKAPLRITLSDDEVNVDLVYVNHGPEPVTAFDPFLRMKHASIDLGRFLLTSPGQEPERDLWNNEFFSLQMPGPYCCFEIPPYGIVGVRDSVGDRLGPGDYSLRVELNRFFLCDERPTGENGIFLDIKEQFPLNQPHPPILTTEKLDFTIVK